MKAHDLPDFGGTGVFAKKRILVANDLSGASDAALVAGFKLALREGAELIVLNVEENEAPASWQVANGSAIACQEDRHRRTRSRITESIRGKLGVSDELEIPPFRVEAVDGDPATQIVLTAFDNRVDLVVVANHREDAPGSLHLGHTAELVARYAPCSVLVVREDRGELDLPPVAFERGHHCP